MPFEAGKSGNPGGRPRKTEEQIRFERRCREWADLFALDRLKKAAGSNKAAEIIAAVKEICDRGFGKAESISYIDASVTANPSPTVADLEREVSDLLGAGKIEGCPVHSAPKVESGE